MITRKGPAILAMVIAFTAGVAALPAAQRRNAQQQRPEQQAQQQGVGPQAASKDEFEGFVALQSEQDPAKKASLGDAFVAKYPNSEFLSFAHQFRLGAYSQTGKLKESIAAAEQAIEATIKLGEKLVARAENDAKLTDKDKENARKKDKNIVFLDKNSPQFQTFMAQSEQRILAFYQSIIQLYQQLNEASKVIEYGEKALGFKPDDFSTLMMVSNVMAERPPASDAERTKHMQRAEELANQALTEFPKFMSSPDASRFTPEQKAELTAQLHYTLGLVYLHQRKLGPSQTEFLTALKSKANDPVAYFRLGIAYVQDMKNDQAMDALAKSVFLKGISEANARDVLKQLYVLKNKSETGLDDYIKAAGAKIGQ